KVDDESQQCVPAFQNATKSVGFWSEYVSPGPNGRPVSRAVKLNGTDVGTSPATAVSLAFDATGSAPITVRYNDAGQMRLNARYSGTGEEAGLLMNGSDSFVTYPAGLCVTSAADCAAGNSTCPVFATAGQPFDLTVTPMSWQKDGDTDFCDNGSTTPNYSQTDIGLANNLISPLPANGGAPGVL